VDTSAVLWTKRDRAGAYYVAHANPPGNVSVTYDRKNSAASRLQPKDLDWKYLLDTRVLHLTGITPALSRGCRQAVLLAFKRARAKAIPVSFDVNHRAKLWSPPTAARTLAPLLEQATLIVMTQQDAVNLFKFRGDSEQVVREIYARFQPGIAVLTLGEQGAAAWDGRKFLHEPGYPVTGVVDRLGAGDAFTAGLLHGFFQSNLALGLKVGVAMSAMKMGMCGDYFFAGISDVQAVIQRRGEHVRR
jgi:2-dehydro-3-deoxygluconokinase